MSAVNVDYSARVDRNDPRRRVTDRLRHVVEIVAFRPVSSWPLAIGRIVLGVTVFVWAITMMFDAEDLLGSNAVVPVDDASTFWRWLPLDSSAAVWAALIGLAVAAICIVVGLRPTVFLLVSFVLLVSIQRRNPVILNSGDIILRDLTLLFALCPTGAACSLDRWRRVGPERFWTAPKVAPWGLRLVQLQVSLVYLFAFWSKSGELWREGVAVSTALRLRDLQRFGELDLLIDSVIVVGLITYGTLIVELLLGVLLWVVRLRPFLIVLGLLLHASIDVLLIVGFFGPALAAGLMSFLDGDAIQRRVDRRLDRRHRARVVDGARREGQPEPDLRPT